MTFNKKIMLQKLEKAKDADGYDVESWVDYQSIWAYANGISNKEFYTNFSEKAESIVNFTVRYSSIFSTIDTKNYRILFQGKKYNILGIDDFEFKHLTVVLRCQEGVNEG